MTRTEIREAGALLHPDRLDQFWRFIHERQTIWERRFVKKERGPWTKDKVLAENRFTNIYRELDPGTIYAVEEILEKPEPAADRALNVMMYRLIGRKETHAALGFQRLEGFDSDELRRALHRIRDRGDPVFTGAYMVSGYNSMGSSDKVVNVSRLFGRLHENFGLFWERLTSARGAEAAYEVLSSAQGFGSFLAHQVLVDLRYPLRREGGKALLTNAEADWASAGPGARKGIAILTGGPKPRPVELAVMRWLQIHQGQEFQRLRLRFPYVKDSAGDDVPISLANIQNCLCEFHKYVKIQEGTGRARRNFVPELRGMQSSFRSPQSRWFA